jgi:DNA-binding beta-propeller fold protein YncE
MAGRVFITNNGTNTVSILNASTGALLKTVVGPHPATAAVDERTHRVFVVHGRGGSRGGYTDFPDFQQGGTTILDAKNGEVLQQIAVGGSPLDDTGTATPANIAVDERRNRVFVINQTRSDSHGHPLEEEGSISVLDGMSGRLLRTIKVGRHPIALAVDEQIDRLFVVNTNTNCSTTELLRRLPSGLRQLLGFPDPSLGCRGSVTIIDTSHV